MLKRFYFLHKIVSFQVNKINMKYFLIISFSLLLTTLNSDDFKELIVTGTDVTKTKTFDLGNNNKFSSYNGSCPNSLFYKSSCYHY